MKTEEEVREEIDKCEQWIADTPYAHPTNIMQVLAEVRKLKWVLNQDK